jgi:HK97 family phage major capsid protein
LTTPEKAENTGLIQGIEKKILSWGGLRNVAFIKRTPNANVLPWVTHDSTEMLATARAKTEAAGKLTPALGRIEFKAYSLGSQVEKVANETLEDTGINMLDLISSDIGESIARQGNKWFTNGAGTTEPTGIVTALTTHTNYVFPTYSSSVDVDWYDIGVQMQDGLEEGYQSSPYCGFMFNRKIKTQLRLVCDALGRPMWQESLTVGEPTQFLGKPYTINADMPDFTDATKGPSIIYGDFNKFMIREVGEINLTVLRERYAELNCTGIVAFARYDSGCLNTDAFTAGICGTGSFVNCGIVPVAAA